jgi:Fe-S cluster assembly iron-binding protein IscA
MKKVVGILILITVLISCGSKSKINENIDSCSLSLTNDSLVFHLDNSTNVLAKTLYTFTDEQGTEYFTFQNGEENEILIFDMKSRQLLKKIKVDYEGADAYTRNFRHNYLYPIKRL